jgi:hypothetical protein
MQLAPALRLVGYALLGVVLVPTVLDLGVVFDPWPGAWPGAGPGPWLAAFAWFALAFHLGASAPQAARRRRFVALALQIPAMLAMAALLPCHFGALTVVIVASQAALLLAWPQVAVWIGVQTLAVGLMLARVCNVADVLASMIGLLGFQSFAAVAVVIGRREEAARCALARSHAELRATWTLLDHASRAQ